MDRGKVLNPLNKTVLMLALLVISSAVVADSARLFALSAEVWARPRAGDTVITMEPVKAAVDYWSRLDGGVVKLSYPGEDSGELWASELRDWLISLGVPGDAIQLVPGLQTSAELRLIVGLPTDINF